MVLVRLVRGYSITRYWRQCNYLIARQVLLDIAYGDIGFRFLLQRTWTLESLSGRPIGIMIIARTAAVTFNKRLITFLFVSRASLVLSFYSLFFVQERSEVDLNLKIKIILLYAS